MHLLNLLAFKMCLRNYLSTFNDYILSSSLFKLSK